MTFDIDDLDAVVSTTECTGLIQALPDTPEQVENYQDIVDIPDIKYKLKTEKKEGGA